MVFFFFPYGWIHGKKLLFFGADLKSTTLFDLGGISFFLWDLKKMMVDVCFEKDTRIDGLLEINSFTLGDLWLNN